MNKLVHQDTFGMGVSRESQTRLLATFYIGGDIYGVDALDVQEIVRYQKTTPVPHAPEYVLGLINLRGQIVTALDLRHRLTGEHLQASEECMNIIIKKGEQICSLLVEEVGDVMELSLGLMEPPPETMSQRMKPYVLSICKLEKKLLNILDTEKVIRSIDK